MQQPHDDDKDAEMSRPHGNVARNSEARLEKSMERNQNKSVASDRATTRTRQPDHDRMSDSYYSEDYENASRSEHSLSASSRSPSPSPQRVGQAKRAPSKPLRKQGARKLGSKPLHSGAQQRWDVRSQNTSKDSSPKDLDLVTKRMLSARLLKINELRNELSELHLRLEQLVKENRGLRQLQHRQERALHRFEDTENEIGQLISQHSGEVRALRERLRRTQERERASDKRLKETEDELQRSRAALGKLRALADDRHLGEREELTRKLAQAEVRLQDNERKIKDLERNIELSTSSFQRQLVAERRKTHEVQDQVKALQEELERQANKLKGKEKELDMRNIYANRMLRPSPKKDTENTREKKGFTGSTDKGVQTEERTLSLEFPTPPPAITDGTECTKDDNYLSLKGGRRTPSAPPPRGTTQRTGTKEVLDGERRAEEKRYRDQELHALEEKTRRLRDEWEREDGDWRMPGGEENRKRQGQGLSQVAQEQEDTEKRGRKLDLQSLESAEEDRRRKVKLQLLTEMREIDQQAQGTDFFADSSEPRAVGSPPRFSEPKNQNLSIFGFTEPVQNGHGGPLSHGAKEPLKKADSYGRKGPKEGPKAQDSGENLVFGSYTPSFGRPMGRAGVVNQRVGRPEEKQTDSPELALEKERKANLLQNLFGPGVGADAPSKLVILSPTATSTLPPGDVPPLEREDSRKRGGFFPLDGDQPAAFSKSALHVTESRPAVRAIPSFDDDIEEVTL